MKHNEQNYNRDNRDNRHDSSNRQDDDYGLSNYLTRYESKGNYYGMRGQESPYNDVRSQGRNYGNATWGPTAGSGSGANSGRGNYDQNDRHTQGQMHQNEWGPSGQYGSDRNKSNYGSGSDHYRYGDQNPYMDNQRNGGYERTRGSSWRENDVDHSNRRYSRQDNSYQASGQGRRFDQYGQDERYNYAHGRQDGRRSIEDSENLDDRYFDRGEHTRSSSENDYGNQYGTNYDHRNRDRQGRDDNYATGSYSSNRAYLADHGQDRDEDMFDHTSDDYPSRSPKGYGRRSGPDYSASSPITNYGPGVRGYQK